MEERNDSRYCKNKNRNDDARLWVFEDGEKTHTQMRIGKSRNRFDGSRPRLGTRLHQFVFQVLRFCYLVCGRCCGAIVLMEEEKQAFLRVKGVLLWMLLDLGESSQKILAHFCSKL
ncbi:hypothetical protein Droror1_Dr00011628 [Drosera rotundifolia]